MLVVLIAIVVVGYWIGIASKEWLRAVDARGLADGCVVHLDVVVTKVVVVAGLDRGSKVQVFEEEVVVEEVGVEIIR